MTLRAAGNGQMQQVRAAWRHAKTTWRRTETSLESLMDANKRLASSLGDAGTAAAKKAMKEFNAAVRVVEKRREKIQRQFSKLVGR